MTSTPRVPAVALQIGRAISRGIRRTLNSTELALIVLTAVYMLTFVGALNIVVVAGLPPEVRDRADVGLTLPLPGAVAGVVVALGMLFGIVLYLAAARAFTGGPAERASFSTELFTRRIGRALASAVGANVVLTVAVLTGLVLLVVPGFFLAVSFVFVVFVIGVEDARMLDAFRRSWGLASGNRWRLFALVLVVGVGTGLLSGLGSVVSVVDPIVG